MAGWEVVVVFLFNLNSCQDESRNKALDQNPGCWTCSGIEQNHSSVPLGQLQMHHFSLGCFSTLGYQIMLPAQSLGEVRVMEMEILYGVSEIFAKSPRKPEITETPVDQKWFPVSQPDTARYELNGCGWSTATFVHWPPPRHCLSVPGHTCFLVVSPLLLSCPAMNWPALLTRVRDAWGHPVLHAASPLFWPSAPPKPATLRSTWEQTGCQAYCNKQSPPPERFIKIVIINSKCLWKWKWGIWQGAEGRRRHLEKDSALLNAIPQPAVGEQISAVG